jgi:hypothetical protein
LLHELQLPPRARRGVVASTRSPLPSVAPALMDFQRSNPDASNQSRAIEAVPSCPRPSGPFHQARASGPSCGGCATPRPPPPERHENRATDDPNSRDLLEQELLPPVAPRQPSRGNSASSTIWSSASSIRPDRSPPGKRPPQDVAPRDPSRDGLRPGDAVPPRMLDALRRSGPSLAVARLRMENTAAARSLSASLGAHRHYNPYPDGSQPVSQVMCRQS